MPKLVDDGEKSYKVKMPDGRVIEVAKSANDPMYKMLSNKVPGVAKVKGDSPKNDTVVVKESPGEIIIPRTHSHSPEAAIQFIKGMCKGGKMPGYSEGGEVEEPKKKKDDESGGDDDFISANEPISVTGVNARTKKIPGYDDGGLVVPSLDTTADGSGSIGNAPVVGDLAQASTVPAPMPSVVQPLDERLAAQAIPQEFAPPAGMAATGATGSWNTPSSVDNTVTGTQSPIQNTPGGVVPANQIGSDAALQTIEGSKSQTQKMLPEDVKAIKDATEAHNKTIIAGANLAASDADKVALVNQQANIVRAKQLEDAHKQQLRDQAVLQGRLDENEKMRKDLASAVIDPSHIWGAEGTGNRLLAIMGMTLGAVGSAFNGKENSAITLVNKAIDRDIEAQKANMAKKGRDYEFARGSYGDLKNKLGDDAAAEATYRSGILEGYANQVKQIGDNSKSAMIQNAAAQQTSAFTAESVKEKGKAENHIYTDTEQTKPKKLLQLPPKVAQQWSALQSGLTHIKDVEDLKKDVGTGLLSGPLGAGAQALGIGSTKRADLDTTLHQLILEYPMGVTGRETASSLGFTKKDIAPGMNTADSTFNAKIATMRKEMEDKLKELQSQYSSVTYEIPTGGTASSVKTFKPKP